MDDYKACATPYQLDVKLTKDCKSPQVDETLYHWLVKSLIYLTHSQLDIPFAVSVVSHLMKDPKEIHFYLKGSSYFGIKYNQRTDLLVNYTESNWDDDGDDWKSTSGFVFHFSSRPFL